MRAKSMVLIVIALGCGLVASYAISQVLEGGANSNQLALETVQIYVATTDIDVNEQLTAQNVRVEDWPKSRVQEGSIADFEQIAERFARVRFYEGEPILKAKLSDEIEGAAVKIPDGHRVCSLSVQMDTSVSGLVKPGDRVDIYGYFKKGSDVPTTGTRRILHNVRVFAVNSQMEQERDEEGRTIVAKTVSVLVMQEQVAKLMLATELGTLRLALRRPNELADETTGESATIESLFGMRSDSGDENQQVAARLNAPNPAGSTAGGFVSFLSGLASRSSQAASPMVASAVAASSAVAGVPRAEWEMVLLTPEGGTNFTWADATGLPVAQGQSSSTEATVPPAPAPESVPPPPTLPGPQDEPQSQGGDEDEDGADEDRSQEENPVE